MDNPSQNELKKLGSKLDLGVKALQRIIVLQAAQLGMRQQDAQKISKMNNNEVSDIWQLIKKGKKYVGE